MIAALLRAVLILLLCPGLALAQPAGGGSTKPGGSNGNVQINSNGRFGAFVGSNCTASQFASSISANGILTCSTPAGGGNVSASALTSGKIPKANGATSIIDSSISDDGAGTISFGSGSPVGTLSLGTITVNGASSGAITVQPQAAAGTYNFNLPTGAGTSGQPLLSAGGGSSPMTFGTVGVAAGGTGLTSGTSGGIPGYTASGTLASSAALGANLPVIGGGAGATPTTGTRSGNTTQFVTTTGTQTANDCVKIDANGNHVAAGAACGSGGGGSGNTTSTSLTSGTVPKANGANSIINSSITDDGAGNVGVGSGSPTGAVSIGSVLVNGSSSGLVSILPQAAAGTYNFNLPTSAGTSGQPLLSGGGSGAAQTYGTLAVAAGGTGITSGTSGGIVGFTASGTAASSVALSANNPVIGGGAGATPTSGTRTGNTTAFVTSTGSLTTGNCAKWDASGNLIDSGGTCGGGGGGGGDFSSNTSSSVDSEFVLFSGTGGKTGKRATGTGLALATSGVFSVLAPTDDNIVIGNGTTWQLKSIPDCQDSGGNHLNYTQSSNSISCGTSSSGGGGTAVNAVVTHSTTQTCATSTACMLAMDTEIDDPQNMHDTVTNNSRITVGSSGVYWVSGCVRVSAYTASTDQPVYFVIYKNGTTDMHTASLPMTASGSSVSGGLCVTGSVRLSNTDYIQLKVFNGTSGTMTFNGDGASTPTLSLTKLGS